MRKATDIPSDKWTLYATQQGFERPPRPRPRQIWYNRKLNISQYDKIFGQGYRYQQKNKFLDLDPIDQQTLRVFSEKPSLIKKKVNLHDEIPPDMFANRHTR